MAAWHSEPADAFQTAPLLPGPAGAIHVTVHAGKGAEALGNPPTGRTGFACNAWSLSHMGQMGFNSWDLRNHLKANRGLILFYKRVRGSTMLFPASVKDSLRYEV